MERFFFALYFNSVQYLDGKYAVLRIKQILIVNNKVDLIKAEVELNVFPFIIKPNRSGKGTGVKLYNNINN